MVSLLFLRKSRVNHDPYTPKGLFHFVTYR
jgi:hypothetical protein